MGTLYNCLREVRLEKYYPAFRANGITCYESLAELSMAELCAMGISIAEDRRRLLELVSIIKSVSRENTTTSAAASSTTTAPQPRKRQPGSPTPSTASARSALSAGGSSHASSSSAGSQSEKKVPRRRPPPPVARNSPTLESGAVGGMGPSGAVGGMGPTHPSGMRLEPTRDVSVRERGPNFSVGSYLDMLEFMSDNSSHSSDPGDHLNDSLDGGGDVAATHHHYHPNTTTRAQPSRNPPPLLRKLDRGGGAVRTQVRSKGYNYGVPGSRDSSGRHRTRGGSGRASAGKDERIRVCVRKRPLNRRESRASDADIVEAESTTTVTVKEPKVAVDLTAFTMRHEFVFDEVFDESCSNEDVYIRAARPLVTTVFQGSNATFFAYGQTGAGKTHTMIGNSNAPGLYQLAAQDMFDIMTSGQYGTDLHVWVSFFEIYCGQLFDLLNKRSRLVAREDGAQRVCIAGLTETEVPDVQTLIRVLQFGNSVRSRGTSGVNPDSSRSHAVLQMEIRHADDSILGKISFIDLAGSERASDMGDPDRQTRMEGAEINQSLLALKECIRSIDQENRHTPFRQSKLTHILKDAFVGNSRTCMISCLSPGQSACEHTLNTLRYADRVKELRRDSSQTGGGGGGERGGGGGGGTTFGQAMNLLMNIPITAPTIFHPSNLLSTSTPVRTRLSDRHHHSPHSPSSPTTVDAGDMTFDPLETPIRGHHIFPKPAAASRMQLPISRPHSENMTAQGSNQQLRGGGNSRGSYSAGAGASQGVLPPHPEASPSESDQTDTDSNNITHPTTSEGRPQTSTTRPNNNNVAVVGSTDTEFDFPTSDFNNVYDDDQQQKQQTWPAPQLNDLSSQGRNNDLGGVKARKTPEVKEGEQASAAASGPMRVQAGWQKRGSNLSPTNQLSGRSGASQSSHRNSPLLGGRPVGRHGRAPTSIPPPSQPPPPADRVPPSTSAAIPFSSVVPSKTGMSELASADSPSSTKGKTTDSFDDELLFGEGRLPVETLALGGDRGNGSSLSNNRHTIKVLPGLQTALSSDLASFSQRSALRLEKAAVNSTDVKGFPVPLSRLNSTPSSPSSRPEDSTTKGAGAYREPSQHGGRATTVTPNSPTSAAVRDWVSQKSDPETGSVRSVKQKMEKAVENTSSLPFTTCFASDPSMQSPSPLDRLGKNAWDSSRPAFPSLCELSGPSSDPVVGSSPMSLGISTPAVHSARDIRPSSACLPSNPERQEPSGESDSNMAWSDGSSVTAATVGGGIGTTKTVKMNLSSAAAVVTEKLMSGAVFSPIHPQPVSTPGGVQTAATRGGLPLSGSGGGSNGIVHPTPMVCGAPSSVSGSSLASILSATASASFSVADRDQARILLVGCHEDQLAAITSLCKQEMKLLLSAKKAVPRSFEDYLSRVGAILSQKVLAIQQLQQSIHEYQARYSTRPPSSTTTHNAHLPLSSTPHMAGVGASSGDGSGLFLHHS